MKKLMSVVSVLLLGLAVSFLAGCGGGGGSTGPGASGENTATLKGNYVNTLNTTGDKTVIYAAVSDNGGIAFRVANQFGELYEGTGTLLANGTITAFTASSVSGTTTQAITFNGTGTISGSNMTIAGKANVAGATTETFTLAKTTSKIPGVFRGTAGSGTASSGAANLAIGVDFNGAVTGNQYKTETDPFVGNVNLTTGAFTGTAGTTNLTGSIDPTTGSTLAGDWADPVDNSSGKFTASKW